MKRIIKIISSQLPEIPAASYRPRTVEMKSLQESSEMTSLGVLRLV